MNDRRVLAFALAALEACSTDTSGLERREPGSDASAGGSGGAGGNEVASGASGGGGAMPGTTDDAPGSLTLIHGIVDGGSLFICLRDAVTRQPLGGDMPQPLGGLPFGRAHSVDLELLAADVEIELIALAPERAAGATCAGLAREIDQGLALPEDAGSNELDAGLAGSDAGVAFPTEPLTPRRAGIVSIATEPIRAGARGVLVAAGCAQPSPPAAEATSRGCGSPDGLFGSYQAIVFVELGREASQPEPYFGLQFLNASRAIGNAEVILQGENQTVPSVRLASAVPFGALRPRAVTSVLEPLALELHVAGAERADYVQTWDDTLAQSSVAAIEPGGRYALVYVGPLSASIAQGFSPPRFVLVPGG